MLTFILFFSLLLLYLILKQIIKYYFKGQTKRYNQKSNFITKYSILIAFTGYCFINPSISDIIINYIIKLINQKFNLSINAISSELNYLSLVSYFILCIFLGYSLYITYKNSNRNSLKSSFIRDDKKNKEVKDIQFPSNDFKESPFLRIRLKNYFELKYQRYNLTINNSDKDSILFGNYIDGFRTYYLFIAYEDVDLEETIDVFKIKDKKRQLEQFSTNVISKNNNEYLIDYYYITSSGVFEKPLYNSYNYYIKTENDILNELIDFNGYLKQIIKDYNNEKIFSAIATEKNKKTLAETFISPFYSVNDQEMNSSNLSDHINDWIKNSADSKHLVLLGDYGMGKTSFLKHYSEQLAKKILNGNNILRFPVVISLTNSSPRHGGIEEKIKAFVADNLGIDYSLFEILIHKGKILFLLDGFDEMGFVGTHEDRFKQINEIWQLASKSNKLIIAGRPSYFPTKHELIKTFNIVSEDQQVLQTNPYSESIYLNLLKENQILEYIRKYHPSRAEEYFNWIIQFPSILELCKRPSMMHIIREMLPKLHRQGTIIDINSHAGIIEKYIDYWINRQHSKNIQSSFDNHIKKMKFVKEFFSDLAVELFLAKQYVLSSDYVLQKLNTNIKKADIKEFKTIYQKEGFENEMLTCYFIEIDDGYYRFVHKSFFEFFVAQKIIDDISNNKFKSNIILEEWSNSIVNFIYDEIPNNLKTSKAIPALLLLTNKKWLGNLKCKLFKFVVTNKDNIVASLIVLALIFGFVFYIQYIELNTFIKIISLIPFLIAITFLFAFTSIAIEDWFKSSKRIQFITKAFKVSFIKGQFKLSDNLELVLPLLDIKTLPHIPIENIEFKEKSFRTCNFYRLKKVTFNSCNFDTPILENCYLNEVTFENTSFTPIIFNNCRFIKVDFFNCTFKKDKKKTTSNLYKKANIESIIHFKNCEFDSTSIENLRKMIKNDTLSLSQISGSDKLIKELSEN